MKVSGRLFLSVLTIILFGCSGPDQTDNNEPGSFESVLESGADFVELAYVPSEGFSYINEKGDLTGVTIELFRDFIGFVNREFDLNIDIRFKPIESFTGFYEYVRDADPGIFGVANVTITESRKEELGFSPPYLTNIATLITHSDVEPVHEMSDLTGRFEGLDILAFEGTLHEERLRIIHESYLPEAEIYFAHSNREIINRTAEVNRYVAYVDIYNFWRAAEQGVSVTRHPAGDEASEQFGVIYPSENDWGDVVTAFFEYEGGYINSERYRVLLITHLGEELAELLIEQK